MEPSRDERYAYRMNPSPSDLELLTRIASADREAFRLFYNRYAPAQRQLVLCTDDNYSCATESLPAVG